MGASTECKYRPTVESSSAGLRQFFDNSDHGDNIGPQYVVTGPGTTWSRNTPNIVLITRIMADRCLQSSHRAGMMWLCIYRKEAVPLCTERMDKLVLFDSIHATGMSIMRYEDCKQSAAANNCLRNL
eukprot:1140-Heterococcus_DN1.PRE.2